MLHDIRHAARSLARSPGFAVTVIATLAVAVGATTAVFSIVNAVLLAPLGFNQPDRLVEIEAIDPKGAPMSVSPQDLMDFRDRTHSFAGVAAIDPGRSMNLTRESEPAARITASRVGANLFSLLGVQAARGRVFRPDEDMRGAAKVVVLSDGAWKRYFGSDPRVIGRKISLDENLYEVVGIAPPGFTFPGTPDVWYPAVWQSWEIGDRMRGYHSIHGIARLNNGATIKSATRDLQSIASSIAKAFPQYDAQVGAMATSLRDTLIGKVERPLWIMLGAVGLVLLIACANVANLLLVRQGARESEISVRVALGAGRWRLVRQLAAESMLLAGIGAALGLLLAGWVRDAVRTFGPADVPRLDQVTLDFRVAAFAIAVTTAAAFIFGIAPALQLTRASVSSTLRAGARGLTRGGNRVRNALVVVELMLGMVLLVGAGLLIRSFENLTHVDPGFRADNLVTFKVALSGKKYDYDAGETAFADEVLRRLSALPGTQSVAVTADRPIDPTRRFEATTSFTVDGETRPAPGAEPSSRLLPVSPSFFETMRMVLVRGRTFTNAENRIDVAPVVVINEALAQRYFPDQNPIGKHLTFGLMHDVSATPGDTLRARGEIVGIVKNVRQVSLASAPEPAAYFPYHTLPFGPTFVVRTNADATTIERAIRDQVAQVDPNVPIYGMGTMRNAIADSVSEPRFYTLLLAAFAGVALLLAALGIYGVISYAVTQRTREFGIRIALGATAADVTRQVVLRGLVLAIVGITAGIVVALAGARSIQSLLFEVQPLDRGTFVATTLLLGTVAIVASWLPALRATRVDPLVAMRAE